METLCAPVSEFFCRYILRNTMTRVERDEDAKQQSNLGIRVCFINEHGVTDVHCFVIHQTLVDDLKGHKNI